MKLNEVTEVGFYKELNDERPDYIYEVFENTDENWLKVAPEAKLLIDEWIYDHTDHDDRRVYETHGTLEQVRNANNIEVVKMTEKFVISGNCGTRLTEDKLTYKEKLDKIYRIASQGYDTLVYVDSTEVKQVQKLMMKILKIIQEQ